MLVLHTLTVQPMHGYAIVQHIKRLTDDALHVEAGSLYPALERLEKKAGSRRAGSIRPPAAARATTRSPRRAASSSAKKSPATSAPCGPSRASSIAPDRRPHVTHRRRALPVANPPARESHARDLDDELAHHLELGAAMRSRTPAARCRTTKPTGARAASSGIPRTRTKSAVRSRDSPCSTRSGQDVRFVLRLLRRRAAFAAVTVATIALGIGSATSIFTVADAVLFRALPFPHADRLIAVWLERPAWKAIPGLAKRWDRGTFSLPLFRTWRAAQTSFDDVAVWTTGPAIAGDPPRPTKSPSEAPVRRSFPCWEFTSSADRGSPRPTKRSARASRRREPRDLGRSLRERSRHRRPHRPPRRRAAHDSRRHAARLRPRSQRNDRRLLEAAGRDSGGATGRNVVQFQAIGRLKPNVSLAAATAESGRSFRAAAADDATA